MTASTQISQAAKDAAAEIDGGWDYASKCEVIQTAMNHAVGEIREQLDQALGHQELPYHTCAGKDCKNSHCQLRQERDRLVDQVEQLKKELTLKQDGNPEWLLARNQDLRQALMPVCQELNIPWGDCDKAKDAIINLCAQVEQRESAIKLLLSESRTLRTQNAELQRDKSCLLAVVRMSYLNTVNDKNLTPPEQKRLGAALFTWGCSNEAKAAYGYPR